MLTEYLKPEIDRVSSYLDVTELIIRAVPSYGITPEMDGGLLNDNEAGLEYEDRLQGRLVNIATHRLSEIKYDVSYYDSSGRFLGLNKSRFLEEDELDIDDHLSIDMKIQLPDGTSTCKFNVRAKKPGIIGKIFWG